MLATQLEPKRIRPTTEYWAGRIDAYVAPDSKGIPPKYTVTFFEGTVDDLERCQFYTSAEEQFMTCSVSAMYLRKDRTLTDYSSEKSRVTIQSMM